MLGTIIKWHRDKGFGFAVAVDDPTLPDIFVHFSELRPSQYWSRKFLLPNMQVRFDVEADPDPNDSEMERLRATNVRVAAPVQIAVQRATAVKP